MKALKGIKKYQKIFIENRYFIYFLYLFISLGINYFYFYKGYFKVGFDDLIHFQAFESVVEAFRNLRLPPVVNFIGFSANGEAFNGMYPWLTSLIFIVPRLIVKNAIFSLYISFCLLSFITMTNSYLLLRKFTQKKWLLISASIIYSFNQYNLINIYNRGALGEALAFAFLPIVFLGISNIWDQKYKKGSILLGLGMGLVLNSHLLTTVLCCLFLLTFELIRVFEKNFNLKELQAIIFAVVLSILTSIYTLTNFFRLTLHNELTTPWRDIHSLDWNAFISSCFKATFNFQANTYNFGMVVLFLMILMIALTFFLTDSGWKKWIVASWVTFLLSISWIPYHELGLNNSFLGTIQFTSRLLNFVVLFLIIGLVVFFEDHAALHGRQLMLVSAILLLVFSVSSEIRYVNNKNISYNLTPQNYQTYVHGSNYAENDYSKKDKYNHNYSIIYRSQVFPLKEQLYEYYNGVQFNVYSSKSSKKYIRFLTYKKQNYQVILNGKIIKPNYSEGLLRLKLRKGVNTIKIISKARIVEYITFILSIVSIIFLTILSVIL